ncbi:MAG: hypothetical protein M3317_00205, partial [Actinomycetota bacterium]|nr:hypothetical protein [Actinomycetota bacterium]
MGWLSGAANREITGPCTSSTRPRGLRQRRSGVRSPQRRSGAKSWPDDEFSVVACVHGEVVGHLALGIYTNPR